MDGPRNMTLVPFVLLTYIYKDDFLVFGTGLVLNS
jgi:hypothetical protein